MTLPEIIETHSLSASHIAATIGISKGTFNNKLKQNNGAYFTPHETDKIKKVLEEIGIDLIKFAYE